jgi:uncharacterized membrane-anchored protein
MLVVAGVGTAQADKAGKGRKKAQTAEKAPPAPEPEPPAEPAVDPFEGLPHITGPKLVTLGHGAEIDLPAGLTLFEKATAQELMRKGGNDAESVVAAILPTEGDATWMVVIEADDVGYVTDDDADELDAATMLEQFKIGTLEQNKKRKTLGVPDLFIDGWSERPRYDRLQRHLVWGLEAHDTDGKVINFFTRFLGRNGFVSVNLIDTPAKIEASKAQALSILTAVRFLPGSQYTDHVDGDRDSGLGLKALVLGGTGVVLAKKGGILIVILLALKKGFIVVIAAIGGFFKWLFGRKKVVLDQDAVAAQETSGAAPPDAG